MRYNQLKRAILELFTTEGWCTSLQVGQKLEEIGTVVLDIHALRMALVRYHRQGLLVRERREGSYAYRLSEKGARRLLWLKEQSSLS